MKIIVCSGLVVMLLLGGAPVQALEPFALLDDFSGDRIDDSIWQGNEVPDSDVLDVAREVTGGELRLMGRSYANTPLPGERTDTHVRLFLDNPAPITQMLALVRVNGVEITGCTDSAPGNTIRGRLAGYFFNTGGPGTPGDATNAVFAAIRVLRASDSPAPPEVLEIGTLVARCGDPDCLTGDILFSDPLGTIAVGQSVLLALLWDPDSDRLIFLRTPPLLGAVFDYAGILTDVDPPGIVDRRVELRAYIENCVTGPRASGFMDLSIDKLWVNQSAVSP